MTRPDRFAGLDRFAPLFPAPELAVESVHRRRARRRLNRAIGAVAAASLAVGGLAALSMTRSSARVITASGTTTETSMVPPSAPLPVEACADFTDDLDALNIRPERAEDIAIPGGDVTLTRFRGDLVATTIEASDQRLTGMYQFGREYDQYLSAGADDRVPPQLELVVFTHRIVTEEGTWSGTEFPDIVGGTDFEEVAGPIDVHLMGRGAYEGLSFVATIDGLNRGECGMRFTGFIVDTMQLSDPPAPED